MPLLAQLPRIGQHDLRLPPVIADWPRRTDALAAERSLGGPEFRAVLPIPTAVKTAFGYGFPKSNNVCCDCASASYLAEATTPQTVAISPMWPPASSGLSGAAIVEKAHDPNTVDATSNLTGLILVSDNAAPSTL